MIWSVSLIHESISLNLTLVTYTIMHRDNLKSGQEAHCCDLRFHIDHKRTLTYQLPRESCTCQHHYRKKNDPMDLIFFQQINLLISHSESKSNSYLFNSNTITYIIFSIFNILNHPFYLWPSARRYSSADFRPVVRLFQSPI